MKTKPMRTARWVALSAMALTASAQADLVHRYSFNESSGTTVKDSVGTADGEIKGQGAYFTGTALTLPGLTSSSDAADTIAGYVDLPNHIINVLTNATFETWVTWDATGSAWQRIFDFGTSAGGEDLSSGNGNYLFLSPQGDANIRFAVRDPATGTEPAQATAGAPLATGEQVCLTVTYNATDNKSLLYSNGVVIATSTASVALSTINDVNNWLGRSQWGDPMFQGSYDEFRIYNTALTGPQVAASYVGGVATVKTDLSALGTVQAVHLNLPTTTMSEADKQSFEPTADFAKMTNISLLGDPGYTVQSDNANVLKVNGLTQVTAVAGGTAKLTLSYLGQTEVVTVTVKGSQTGVAVAGSLVVDLRAADEKNGTSTWPNRAGTGEFVSVGNPVYDPDVAGTGVAGVQFTGAEAYAGPLTTSDLDGASDRSIEVWAFNPAAADEETLVALGHRGGPDGSNLSFNYGANATYGAVGHWGSFDMGWGTTPAAGKWHYLVYTYDGAKNARVYADGKVKTDRTLSVALNTYANMPIRIGAQGNTAGDDADLGQALSGAIALVRVHTGKLSEAEVANNFLYGAELTDPGALNGATLKLSKTDLVGADATATATVIADYANRKYLDVTGFTTFTSSDPSVAKVDEKGTITALKVGTAEITATYKTAVAKQTVTVAPPPTAKLVHRYSFGEAVGSTTVKDSVGSADGTVKGTGAEFDGQGQLSLPGGTTSSAEPPSGYVDLPNHIINVLTNLTIETWVTYQAPSASAWQRIFDFGTSSGGEDIINGDGNYIFLAPEGGANLRFAFRDPATGTEPVQLTSTAPLGTGKEIFLAVVYNYDGNVSRLYSNSVVVASGGASVSLTTIDDVNNWLGRSQYASDPMFQGKYNEFRIYDGAKSEDEIKAAYAAGPDQLPSASVEKPTLGAALTAGSLAISWPATATGFGLESSLTLGSQAAWTTVDVSNAVEKNGVKTLTLPAEGVSKFYRLKK